MKELLIMIGGILVIEIPLIFIMYKQNKTILEQGKMLASRTYTEYSVGESRIEKAKKTEEEKPTESYEQVWER